MTSFDIQQSEEEGPVKLSVSEMTTRHLRRLVASAADFLGRKVNAVVITVPTDFTTAQKQALTDAAKAADLEVLQFIHEPVAAVLAYSIRDEGIPADKNVVIADFGGTRSDVTVVTSRGGMYTILATAHDYELGGAQLDEVLVDYFAKEFQKRNKVDPKANPRGLAKLKQEVEGTKKTLSLSTSATISIDSLADGYDFHSLVNRTRYELLAKKVFDQMVKLVETAVAKADLDLLDIDEVCWLYNPATIRSEINGIIGHSCRRSIPHPKNRPASRSFIPSVHPSPCPGNIHHLSQPLGGFRPRSSSTGSTDTGLRQGGHRPSHAPYGHCRPPSRQDHRRLHRQRRCYR